MLRGRAAPPSRPSPPRPGAARRRRTRTASAGGRVSSSGVTTSGPRPSAKSRSFGGGRPGARHSARSVKPPSAPSAPITAASLGSTVERIAAEGGGATVAPGPTIAVGLANAKTCSDSKTRTDGGCCTGARKTTSASGYSACSRALAPPLKKCWSVCAARCTTRSPSTRPTQPRSSGRSPRDGTCTGARRDSTGSAQGSVCTITSATPGSASRTRAETAPARSWASASGVVASRASVRNTTRPSSVRSTRVARGSAPVA